MACNLQVERAQRERHQAIIKCCPTTQVFTAGSWRPKRDWASALEQLDALQSLSSGRFQILLPFGIRFYDDPECVSLLE